MPDIEASGAVAITIEQVDEGDGIRLCLSTAHDYLVTASSA